MFGDIIMVHVLATNLILLNVKVLTPQYLVRPCTNLENENNEITNLCPVKFFSITANTLIKYTTFAKL